MDRRIQDCEGDMGVMKEHLRIGLDQVQSEILQHGRMQQVRYPTAPTLVNFLLIHPGYTEARRFSKALGKSVPCRRRRNEEGYAGVSGTPGRTSISSI